jgi:DNA-binding transcriptional MerR regulator
MKIGEAAKIIGVSVKTLQRWDEEGVFKALRNPKNQRYYTEDQIKNFARPTEPDGYAIDVVNAIQEIKQAYALLEATNRLDVENIRVHIFADTFFYNTGYDFKRTTYDVDFSSREKHTDLTVYETRNNTGSRLFVTFVDEHSEVFENEIKQHMKKIECKVGIIVNKMQWKVIIDKDKYELNFSGTVDEEVFSKLSRDNIDRLYRSNK